MTAPGIDCELCGRRTDGALCWPCTEQLGDHLRAIIGPTRRTSSIFDVERAHGLAADLELAETRQGVTPGNRGGKTGEREQPIPVDLRASNARQKLDNALFAALDYIGERTAPGLTHRAGELLRLLHVLRRHRGASQHVTAIADAAHHARDILQPPKLEYVGPCDGHTGPDQTVACTGHLRVEEGHPTVTCQTCGRGHDVQAVRARLSEAAAGQLLQAHDIARALTATNGEAVPYGTVRQWINRGRLIPATRTGSGRAVYRVSDAQALLATRRNADIPRRVAD